MHWGALEGESSSLFRGSSSRNEVIHTAKNSLRRSSMLPLWMVNKAAAIWLIAFAKQWMLLQCPKQKHTQITSASCLKMTVFFRKYHQRVNRLVTMKDQLLASYTTGAKYWYFELGIREATRSTELPSECCNGDNNLTKIPVTCRNKGK